MPDENKQTLDQKRASAAYELVERVSKQDESAKKKFKTQVKRMPVRIMTSGLGPSLAFLLPKDRAPELLKGLGGWISHPRFAWAKPHPADPASDQLLLDILRGSTDFLRLATAETLAYLQWVGRFTEALLKDVKTEGESTD